MLTPLLFILYIISCRSQYEGHYVVKFADYSPILPLVYQNSSEPDPVVNDFIQCCKSSFVDINVTKTHGMIVDCGENSVVIPPLTMQKNSWLRCFLILGTLTDAKPTFMPKVDAVCEKAHQAFFIFYIASLDISIWILFIYFFLRIFVSLNLCSPFPL